MARNQVVRVDIPFRLRVPFGSSESSKNLGPKENCSRSLRQQRKSLKTTTIPRKVSPHLAGRNRRFLLFEWDEPPIQVVHHCSKTLGDAEDVMSRLCQGPGW